MTEEASVQTNVDVNTSTTRQRKKRKWDQPAEAVMSAAASVPGLLPFSGTGALAGIFPSLVGMFPNITTATASAQISPTVSAVQQSAAAIVQKINQDLATKGLLPQAKIQDELIAREIVINDAEPSVRYKLTKRQTQEDIQLKTGAVVITRGRYRPPNGPVDHEKPLYLHISAGAHLKDTAERIKAVDQAAALVEEMLKQGRQQMPYPSSTTQLSSGVMTSPLSAAVFVDFEADSSLNLVTRIRGPNDQYINHIMNETGATVVLKGKGSNTSEGSCGEALPGSGLEGLSSSAEIPQPLHLFISADNPKSLDDARRLAENLLETIRSEFIGPRPPSYFQPAGSYNVQQPLPPYQVSSYVATSVVPGGFYPYPLPQLSSQQSSVLTPGSVTMDLPEPAVATPTSLLATNSDVNRSVSSKVYSAVPPPMQLLTSDQQTGKSESESESGQTMEEKPDSSRVESSSVSTASISTTPFPASSVTLPPAAYAGYPALSTPYSTAAVPHLSQQGYGSYPQASQVNQPYSAATTSYSAYSGLYPQASPLQQVALALQRPPHPVTVKPGSLPSESTAPTKSPNNSSQGQGEKQERQRRKFREFPLAGKEPSNVQPGLSKRAELASANDPVVRKQHTMPPPKAMPPQNPMNMPPPPPKSMTSPPSKNILPPPMSSSAMATSSSISNAASRNMPPPLSVPLKTYSAPPVENTAIEGFKLVEYGEDEDDMGTPDNGRKEVTPYANGKPFWAA